MAIHKDFAIVKTVLCSVTSLLKVSLGPSVRVRACACACVSEAGALGRLHFYNEAVCLELGAGEKNL